MKSLFSRKFVTFGVINGMIRRVHQYPLKLHQFHSSLTSTFKQATLSSQQQSQSQPQSQPKVPVDYTQLTNQQHELLMIQKYESSLFTIIVLLLLLFWYLTLCAVVACCSCSCCRCYCCLISLSFCFFTATHLSACFFIFTV